MLIILYSFNFLYISKLKTICDGLSWAQYSKLLAPTQLPTNLCSYKSIAHPRGTKLSRRAISN